MALIKCYECSREISDKAPACPQCGAPKKKAPSKKKVGPKKKSSAPKKKTPVSEAARAKGVESDRIIREIIDKKARKKAAATKKKAAPKKKTPVREAARARKKSSALITVCESCGGKISKRLDSCPHCGWSTKPTISCPDCGASFAVSLPACPECGGPRA